MLDRVKLAVQSLRRFAIGGMSLFCRSEVSKVFIDSIRMDIRLKPLVSLVEGNSLESAAIIDSLGSVVAILTGRGKSQVGISIIQPVSVDVICHSLVAKGEPENHPVHVHLPTVLECGYGVESSMSASLESPPSILTQLLESMRRYFRNLTLGEGNFTVFFSLGCLHLRSFKAWNGSGAINALTPLVYQEGT